MEIKELKIGNCLHYKNTNDIAIVELIHKKHFDCRDEYGSFTPNGNYQPIPLTEEWLLKFGFEHSKPNYWFKNDNKFRFSLIDNNLHCSMGDDDYGILYNRLNHVHQLQNLYFALTNEELKWK